MVVKSIVISLSLVTSFVAQAEEFASRTYQFYPQQPVIIENPLFWQLDIRCAMDTDNENVLFGTMKKNGAVINGQPLKQGQSTSVAIKNRDNLRILADNGAKIEIINYGKSRVTATCSI